MIIWHIDSNCIEPSTGLACASVAIWTKKEVNMAAHMIYPDSVHPLYEGSMRLRDVAPGVRYIAVNAVSGVTSAVKLTSGWWVEDDIVGILMVTPYIFAEDEQGNSVNLCDDGVHPYFDGSWSESRFAVIVTDENIRTLHAWFKERGQLKAAERLSELFPGLMAGLDDSFWDRLTKHLNC